MNEDTRYLTCAEVAALFGIPAEHIRRKAIRREIPHTRFGRRHIRFSLQDVAEIEQMHRVLPLLAEKPRRYRSRRQASSVVEIQKPQRRRSQSGQLLAHKESGRNSSAAPGGPPYGYDEQRPVTVR